MIRGSSFFFWLELSLGSVSNDKIVLAYRRKYYPLEVFYNIRYAPILPSTIDSLMFSLIFIYR